MLSPDVVDAAAVRDDVTLEGVEAFKNFLVITEREGGLAHLRVMSTGTDGDTRMALPESLYTVYGTQNPNYDTTTFRIGYQSMVTPRSVFDVDLVTGERLKRPIPCAAESAALIL